ncbi:hypothetical protein H5410_046225 [Solanum commersonii]|uniref:Uncharacterized protein n=1 Tax=Solanum commersonii TaxID=4109 RepID=A0A9J5XDV5_SOLCO|nr:hypothetical protein H5410_046225 [Solanum commersonii]
MQIQILAILTRKRMSPSLRLGNSEDIEYHPMCSHLVCALNGNNYDGILDSPYLPNLKPGLILALSKSLKFGSAYSNVFYLVIIEIPISEGGSTLIFTVWTSSYVFCKLSS